MDIDCSSPAETPQEIVIVVDRYSNTTENLRFSELPQNIKFKEATLTCDGKTQIVQVPVAEIRVASMDGSGKLVPSENAVALFIEYIDRRGNVLQSVRMETNWEVARQRAR